MAFEVKFIDGGEGLIFVASGKAHASELIAINREIYSEAYLMKQKYQLVDLTGAESIQVEERDIRQLAEMDKEAAAVNPEIKIVVVAPGDLEYGMARMWLAHVDEGELESRVFRTREEADRWIEKILSGA
jgi:hypothetical protein